MQLGGYISHRRHSGWESDTLAACHGATHNAADEWGAARACERSSSAPPYTSDHTHSLCSSKEDLGTSMQDHTIWRAEPGSVAKRCRLHNAVRCFADTACSMPLPQPLAHLLKPLGLTNVTMLWMLCALVMVTAGGCMQEHGQPGVAWWQAWPAQLGVSQAAGRQAQVPPRQAD